MNERDLEPLLVMGCLGCGSRYESSDVLFCALDLAWCPACGDELGTLL